MADKTIAIYCFLDDFFKVVGHKTDAHCKLSDAEIATTALIAALYFNGNQTKACDYMQQHHKLRMIDKSGFNRRLHRLQATLLTLFRFLATTLKELNTSARYIIDSFPVAVCRNCRIPVCRLLEGKAYHGYNEAKKEYFYGFKPGRPLGLWAGNIPRIGLLPVVNQIGPPKRWGTLTGRRGVKDLCSEWSAVAVSPHSV